MQFYVLGRAGGTVGLGGLTLFGGGAAILGGMVILGNRGNCATTTEDWDASRREKRMVMGFIAKDDTQWDVAGCKWNTGYSQFAPFDYPDKGLFFTLRVRCKASRIYIHLRLIMPDKQHAK